MITERIASLRMISRCSSSIAPATSSSSGTSGYSAGSPVRMTLGLPDAASVVGQRIAEERGPLAAVRASRLERVWNALRRRPPHPALELRPHGLRIHVPDDPADELLGAVTRGAEDLRRPRIDVAEAPLGVV